MSKVIRKPKVTANDVAELAGVSQASVSRVLTGSYPTSSEIHERVTQAATELGYVPNMQAVRLRRGRSSTIAVVVFIARKPSAHDADRYSTMMLEQIWRSAEARNIDVLLSFVSNDESVLHDYSAQGSADGTIVIGSPIDGLVWKQISQRKLQGENIACWKYPEDWFDVDGHCQSRGSHSGPEANEHWIIPFEPEMSRSAELLVSLAVNEVTI